MATIVERILSGILSKTEELKNRVSGAKGCKLLTGTGAHTGLEIMSIQVNEDAVMTVFKVDGVDSLSAYGLSGATLKSGLFISVPAGSKITDVTLSSGSVMGYND